MLGAVQAIGGGIITHQHSIAKVGKLGITAFLAFRSTSCIKIGRGGGLMVNKVVMGSNPAHTFTHTKLFFRRTCH